MKVLSTVPCQKTQHRKKQRKRKKKRKMKNNTKKNRRKACKSPILEKEA